MQARPARKAAASDDALLNQGVEEIIREHDGDPRAAVRSLLEMVSYFEKARDRGLDLVSVGDARSKLQ